MRAKFEFDESRIKCYYLSVGDSLITRDTELQLVISGLSNNGFVGLGEKTSTDRSYICEHFIVGSPMTGMMYGWYGQEASQGATFKYSADTITNLDTSEDVVLKFNVQVDGDSRGVEVYSIQSFRGET